MDSADLSGMHITMNVRVFRSTNTAIPLENDYLYSLDVRQFNIVPDHYISEADTFVVSEKGLSNGHIVSDRTIL
jgi:hypothetical protein